MDGAGPSGLGLAPGSGVQKPRVGIVSPPAGAAAAVAARGLRPAGTIKPAAVAAGAAATGSKPTSKAPARKAGGQRLGRMMMGRAARTNAATANASSQPGRTDGIAVGAAGTATRGGGAQAAQAVSAGEADDGFTGTFAKELPMMMYGYGDDESPLQETVEATEAALMQYVATVAARAQAVASTCMKAKPDERDVMFVVRKDPAKFARIKELLQMQQVIKDYRSIDKSIVMQGE